jgi:hypothetical protein
MTNRYYKTVLQVEVLSDGPVVESLPVDKLLSYLEYEGSFGHNSNYITIVSTEPLTAEKLELECGKHGTDATFFTGLDKEILHASN